MITTTHLFNLLLNFIVAGSVLLRNNTIICNEEQDDYCYWNTDLRCVDNLGSCEIECTASLACWHSTISCGDGNDCTIICSDTDSCAYSTINCANSNTCDITCNTCRDSTINCPTNDVCFLKLADFPRGVIHCPDHGKCSIECNKCAHSTINCPATGDCQLICNPLDSSTPFKGCQNSIIRCPENGKCDIWCGYASCESATILCPTNAVCAIHCSHWRACIYLEIDASDASMLSITGCFDGTDTCASMIVWCPPNVNGQERCFIQGDNSLHGDFNDKSNDHSLVFYALNSWKDINFDAYFGTLFGKDAVMYCGANYSHSCNISELAWKCSDESSTCNVPTMKPTRIPTKVPVRYPTMYPTIQTTEPVTNPPSRFPTMQPTVPFITTDMQPGYVTTNLAYGPQHSHTVDDTMKISIIILCVLMFLMIVTVIILYLHWNGIKMNERESSTEMINAKVVSIATNHANNYVDENMDEQQPLNNNSTKTNQAIVFDVNMDPLNTDSTMINQDNFDISKAVPGSAR